MSHTLRVKMIWRDDSWRVDLPEYTMIPGTCQPIIPDVVDPNNPLFGPEVVYTYCDEISVLVVLPDSICDTTTGEISVERIRARYKGQPRWETDDRVPDIAVLETP